MLEELFWSPLFWLVVALVVTIKYFLLPNLSSKREPPSPWGFPVIGHLPFLGKKMNLSITNYAAEYGDIFQIWIGSRKIVVINYQRAIRAAAALPDFNGRPNFLTYKKGFGAFGIPGYPPRAKLYKKLTMKAMSVFTVDRKNELQDVAYRAVDMLMEELDKKKGEPIEPKPLLSRVIWTIMGYVCYGRYFSYNDPEVNRVFDHLPSFTKTMAFGVIVDYFPWARFLLRSQLNSFDALMGTMDSYSKKLTQANIDSYDPDAEEPIRNFCDLFRKEGEEMTPEEKKELQVTDETLLEMGGSLFGAGFGTIASMTRWAVMYLAKYPDVQQKCQDEIDCIIGRNHYPAFEDMKNLPYNVATMTEIYRIASMAALGITHAAVKNTTFEGYFIAKGTPVLFNLWSAHRDPAIFDKPDVFNPDRFLIDGELDKKGVENIMPFGLGARRCGGEPIARLETFLFFATILQRCTIREHPDHPLDPTNYFMGLGLDLLPFKVVFEQRS